MSGYKAHKAARRRVHRTRDRNCSSCSHRIKEYGKDGLAQYFCEAKDRLRIRPFGSPCEYYDSIYKPKADEVQDKRSLSEVLDDLLEEVGQ